MATTYSITTVLNGAAHTVDYWPDGNGQQWPGYVTSLSQYRAELRDSLTRSNLRLYVVTSTGHAELIDSDHDLTSAVESLPNGGALSVTAVARPRRTVHNRNNNAHVEYYARHWYDENDRQYTDDTDTDTDTDNDNQSESDSEDEDESPNAPTSRTRVRAIMKRFNYAWYTADDDDNDATWHGDAPSGTLQREDDHAVRPEVAHLQYILTRLGYMPLSATKQLVGSYQSNTESAVRSFRRAYGITGGDMSVYNRRTAKKMGQVVRHLRSQGHNYI